VSLCAKAHAFRVDICLGSPMVEQTSPMFLDSLLGALNHGDHALAESDGVPMASIVFLLDKLGHDKRNPSKSARRGFTRKPAVDQCASEYLRTDGLLIEGKRIGSMRLKPVVSSGKLKAYGGEGTYITSRWYSHAVAWGVGDIDSVRKILSGLTHLGAKSKLGYGAVTSLAVLPDKTAEKYWAYRVLPETHASIDRPEMYVGVISPIKGPYWDSKGDVKAQLYIGDSPDLA